MVLINTNGLDDVATALVMSANSGSLIILFMPVSIDCAIYRRPKERGRIDV